MERYFYLQGSNEADKLNPVNGSCEVLNERRSQKGILQTRWKTFYANANSLCRALQVDNLKVLHNKERFFYLQGSNEADKRNSVNGLYRGLTPLLGLTSKRLGVCSLSSSQQHKPQIELPGTCGQPIVSCEVLKGRSSQKGILHICWKTASVNDNLLCRILQVGNLKVLFTKEGYFYPQGSNEANKLNSAVKC